MSESLLMQKIKTLKKSIRPKKPCTFRKGPTQEECDKEGLDYKDPKFYCGQPCVTKDVYCRHHRVGNKTMHPSTYYSRAHQKFVTPIIHKPEKGDLRYIDTILSVHDGAKWRRTCEVCWTQATPSGCCKTHDPENPTSNPSISNISCRFIDQLAIELDCKIVHGHIDTKSGQTTCEEYKIPGTDYKVDGYIPEDKIVIEFLGDYWHGHFALSQPEKFNFTTKKFHAEIYNKTFNRLKTIADKGYTIFYIWEKTYKEIRKDANVKLVDHLILFDPNRVPQIDLSTINLEQRPVSPSKSKKRTHDNMSSDDNCFSNTVITVE